MKVGGRGGGGGGGGLEAEESRRTLEVYNLPLPHVRYRKRSKCCVVVYFYVV